MGAIQNSTNAALGSVAVAGRMIGRDKEADKQQQISQANDAKLAEEKAKLAKENAYKAKTNRMKMKNDRKAQTIRKQELALREAQVLKKKEKLEGGIK